jgi:hypothetical protein
MMTHARYRIVARGPARLSCGSKRGPAARQEGVALPETHLRDLDMVLSAQTRDRTCVQEREGAPRTMLTRVILILTERPLLASARHRC